MMIEEFSGNRIINLLKATFHDWMEDNALRLSVPLAFYSIFSITPLVVIAIGVAGLVLGEDAVRGHLANQLNDYVDGFEELWTIDCTLAAVPPAVTNPLKALVAVTAAGFLVGLFARPHAVAAMKRARF